MSNHMTEPEAKKKWCPFARSSLNGRVANRTPTGQPDEGAMCLASECMAWRRKVTNPQYGHCGNAGNP